jgi:hypothetical protein
VTAKELEEKVRRDGFAFARAADARGWLTRGRPGALADWEAFAASWDDLRPDGHMADGGRDRLRRHAVFAARPGEAPRPAPHRPHFQSRDYNPLNGGVARLYEPVSPAVAAGATMTGALAFCADLFGRLRPGAAWDIEVHQFRIVAATGLPGRPTPEGVHRDGVDCVLALLVRRENVASGTTTVFEPAGRALGSFTLTEPLDAAIVDDARVLHGVTPVVALDPSRPAFRDVLVATFRAV